MRIFPPYFVDRARDLGPGAQGHGGRGRAVHRHQHLEDGQRARGLSVRRLRGPVPHGLEGRAQGTRDVSAEQGARRGALGRAADRRRARRRAAGRGDRKRTGACRSRLCPRRCSPRSLARPADAPVGQPRVDLHDRASARRVRAVRRARRRGRPGVSVRGVGERRRAAARSGRGGEDAVDGHAREGPRLAQAQARRALEDRRRRLVRDAVPAARRAAAGARRRRRRWRRCPLALRRPRRADRAPIAAEGRRARCSTRCSAVEEPRTGTDGTLSWTVDVRNPASGEDFVARTERNHAAGNVLPGRRDAAILHVACRAIIRARSTGSRGSFRSTCACSTRRGSA